MMQRHENILQPQSGRGPVTLSAPNRPAAPADKQNETIPSSVVARDVGSHSHSQGHSEPLSLVQYSDSESDGEDGAAQTPSRQSTVNPRTSIKRERDDELPPLPPAFHDVYTTNARVSTSDDPSLHGGRKRAVPHVEGNWPSHVYLEWVPSYTEFQSLQNLVQFIQESILLENKTRAKPLPVPDITPSLQSPLGAPLPLHISLSRTLQIRTADRDEFSDTLKSSLRRAAVRTFPIDFTALKWVPNFERNRWFLVLSIAKPPQDELNRLLTACNDAVERCGHAGLYTGGSGDGPMEQNAQPASRKRRRSSHETKISKDRVEYVDRTDYFHISIAWNLVEPAPEWLSLIEQIDVADHVKSPAVPFDVVKAKIGNVVHNVELGPRKSGLGKGRGILGLG